MTKNQTNNATPAVNTPKVEPAWPFPTDLPAAKAAAPKRVAAKKVATPAPKPTAETLLTQQFEAFRVPQMLPTLSPFRTANHLLVGLLIRNQGKLQRLDLRAFFTATQYVKSKKTDERASYTVETFERTYTVLENNGIVVAQKDGTVRLNAKFLKPRTKVGVDIVAVANAVNNMQAAVNNAARERTAQGTKAPRTNSAVTAKIDALEATVRASLKAIEELRSHLRSV